MNNDKHLTMYIKITKLLIFESHFYVGSLILITKQLRIIF